MERIKILFFIETIDGGGAEKVLRNLVNQMDRSRFDITVQTVYPGRGENLLASGIRYRYLYSGESRLHRFRYRLEAALGLAYPLHIRDGYDIECAFLECGSTKIMAGSTNRKAAKLAWVHCDLQKAMPDPKGFAAKTLRHYRKFDKVVCVSQQGQRSFGELFGNAVETTIVYNTVDCQEIRDRSREPVQLPEGKPLVVSLGRLSRPKHYLRLLKAHKMLLEEGIFHNLLILGEGPDRQALEDYVRENRLEETVRMPGFVENPYPYLCQADILACSSVYECYSTFVTEGLILGKPIVTTDVSGMRELLGDSEFGLITGNADDAFREGLKQLLLSEKLRQEYACKAARRGADFSTRKLVDATEAFFENCVREKQC